jgi:hypothetical protein
LINAIKFIKSNKGYSNISPLQNIIQDEGLEEVVYEDDEKCELLNKYFSFISSLDIYIVKEIY